MSHSLSKKVLMSLSAFFMAAALFTTSVNAQQRQVDSPVPAMIEEKLVKGPHFFANDNVIITEDLEGDVYIGGGTVLIESTINGDLIVGAGEVTLNGEVTDDVRIGAGTVMINGMVGDDLTVGAGQVSFGPDSLVMGSALVGSGNASFGGQIDGDVWVGAGIIKMMGVFGQDVRGEVGEVIALPETSIGGDLGLIAEKADQFSSEALIGGTKNIKIVEEQTSKAKQFFEDDNLEKIGKKISVVKSLFGIVISFVCASVLLYLFPKASKKLSEIAAKSPVGNMGWGLAYIVLAPIVVMLLMISVVGIPLGLLSALAILADMIVAKWVAGYALGIAIAKKVGGTSIKGQYAQVFVGLLVLGIVGMVPVLGWFVNAAAFLIGMGVLAKWLKGLVEKK